MTLGGIETNMPDESKQRDSLKPSEEPVVLPTRTTRREIVKAGAAVVGGVAAASYIKPSLTALGVPAAVASSGTTCWVKCNPNQCEIDIDIQFQCWGGGFPYEVDVDISCTDTGGKWSVSCGVTKSDSNGGFANDFSCTLPWAGIFNVIARYNSPYTSGRALTTMATTLTATTTITAS